MENNENLYVSTNIKYLRNANNKSRKDLAKYCNVGTTAIGNWETGIRTPDPVKLKMIADYFNVSIDDIITKNLSTNDVKYEEISSIEFMKEVLPLIDNVVNLSEKEKNKLKNEIRYICEDDE